MNTYFDTNDTYFDKNNIYFDVINTYFDKDDAVIKSFYIYTITIITNNKCLHSTSNKFAPNAILINPSPISVHSVSPTVQPINYSIKKIVASNSNTSNCFAAHSVAHPTTLLFIHPTKEKNYPTIILSSNCKPVSPPITLPMPFKTFHLKN